MKQKTFQNMRKSISFINQTFTEFVMKLDNNTLQLNCKCLEIKNANRIL